MMYRFLLWSCLVATAGALPAPGLVFPAFAGQVEREAERRLLQDEMEKFTARNQWAAVERTYEKLMALNLELRAEDHLWGSQGASVRGDIGEAYSRLKRAIPDPPVPPAPAPVPAPGEGTDVTPAPEPAPVNLTPFTGAKQTAWESLQSIESRYGLVSVHVAENRVAALIRLQQPFNPEEKLAIEHSRTLLREKRSFEGFLPVGRYMVDGQFFDVTSGTAGQVIHVGDVPVKPGGGNAPAPGPGPEMKRENRRP